MIYLYLKLYFKRIIDKNKYDVFHFQLLNFKTLYILELLKDLNQKVVVTFQGIDIQIDRNINYGYRLNESYEKKFLGVINRIDKFLSISENIKNDLLNLRIDKNKIIMIPNAIEKSKFLQFEDKNINKKFPFTVARFAKKKKGFDLLPSIAKLLDERKIDFQWTIVGHNSKNIQTIKDMKNFEKYFKYLDNIENLDKNSSTQRPNKSLQR